METPSSYKNQSIATKQTEYDPTRGQNITTETKIIIFPESEQKQNKTITRQIISEPEINAAEKVESIFFSKVVTRPSWHNSNEKNGNTVVASERPISLRRIRAELVDELLRIKRENPIYDEFGNKKSKDQIREARKERSKLHEKIKALDSVLDQYLNQKEIRISILENDVNLGEQSARYIILEPPKDSKEAKEAMDLPPIFFIPGISNDLASVGNLVRELGLTRRVIVVGYPESHMGSVTAEFAQAISNSQDMALHTQFFTKALTQLLGDGPVELWGHSAGGEIIFEMLNNPELQQVVSNAVVLCPAATANISLNESRISIAQEFKNMFFSEGLKTVWSKYKDFPKYALLGGRKASGDPFQKLLKEEVFNDVRKIVTTLSLAWINAKVSEGGKIVILSGGQDEMTKSYKTFNDENEVNIMATNPQISIVYLKDGSHITPLTKSAKVIDLIADKLK